MYLHKLLTFFSGDSDTFSLEKRVFHFTAAAAILTALIAGVENFCLGLPLPLTMLMFIYMGIMTFLYSLSRFLNHFHLARLLACLLLVLFFAPAEWIMNGGVTGGAHYTFLFYGMALCAVCSGWQRNLFLGILMAITAGLGIFEFYYPQYILYCDDRTIRYIDVISSFLITIALTVILFLVYLRDYDHERARVLEYSRLLEKMAITDGLTGLFNHSYIYQLLEDRIQESLRYGNKLSLVMFDLDHFKAVNDTFGHEFGNKVLMEVANTLKQKVRSADLLGRYGGEEFLLICPETNLEEALTAAERLRKAVENLVFGNGLRITISGGAAEFDMKMLGPAASLIEYADDALYLAKRLGRNRIMGYGKPAGTTDQAAAPLHLEEPAAMPV